MESDSADLVRMTLLGGGASAALVESLIPQRPLQDGEQYRFHFDMTKCIGCRSCEVACNEQNGNPADIKWRRVGELEGGTYPHTLRTYLSMGCNHCLSADCLRGCPVNAYSKDPLTGIVLHSADACIGCQYCVWNCPYSVPQFNPERGVVGKCDMCRSRLLDGREPACVNACPENAIQVEIVNKVAWLDNHGSADSPGMPSAGQTISTTRITLPARPSSQLERVDTGSFGLEHAHPSLICMTTAMQAAFGALVVLTMQRMLDPISMTLLLLLTTAALNISVLHLGRPAYAWRALKMWRRSWLSREVLLFSLFYVAVVSCTLSSWLNLSHSITTAFAWAGVAFGLAGTVASSYIYLVKSRPSWNMIHTPLDFLLSATMLGSALAGTIHVPATWVARALEHLHMQLATLPNAAQPKLVAASALIWIANQIAKAMRLRQTKLFEKRASYGLLRSNALFWKFTLALMGAAACALFSADSLSSLALLMAVVAVILGRYIFFVSVVPLNMGLTFLNKRHALEVAA